MKKSTAGIALAAAAGFTALSAAPAMAVHLPFPNCDTAAAAGVFNIPEGSPAFQQRLDADNDGFGCDAAGTPPFNPALVEVHEAAPLAPPAPVDDQQMGTMPIGGADTGVTQKSATDVAGIALGGGLLLAAAAGGTYIVRRRTVS